MSYCWYCCWGWPKAVAEIYLRAAKDINDIGHAGVHWLECGPTHCIWSDENFGGDFAWYLKAIEAYDYSPNTDKWPDQIAMAPEVMAIVKRSVLELLAIPEDERDPEWRVDDDEEGDHPELAPPPPHIPWMTKAEIDKRSRELE